MENKKPLIYLGGGIMTRGENLAREEEYEKFKAANLDVNVYSPVMNKSINDKSNMTEEENNHLAEKICEADIERLWNSDVTVMCPEQSAIGTMCEMGVLYGWQYMCEKLLNELKRIANQKNYAHYFDIRTNHLNEKDWRRSFSINQMLYGMILYATADHTLHNSFDEILSILKEKCNNRSDEYVSDYF